MAGPNLKRCVLIAVVSLGTTVLAAPQHASAITPGSAGYAWGDFDADGFGDLAIGAPGEGIGTRPRAGAVHILYGTDTGLTTSSTQIFHQNSPGISGEAETGDQFGAALTVGDFNGDGADDLVIGAPGESIGSAVGAGVITVIYADAPAGLKGASSVLLRQGAAAISGGMESGDGFGSSLTAGDYDGDGFDDAVVGVPGEGVAGVSSTGLVHTLMGASDAGLSGVNGTFITQSTDGVPGSAESGDRFGYALSTGDYDGDGKDDLTVGVPYEAIGDLSHAGAVYAFYGSEEGPDPATTHIMTQDTVFTEDGSGAGDAFGFALASGNFNPAEDADVSGSFDDLAIGAPGDLDGSSGAINIVDGSNEGFVEVAEVWYQAKGGETGAVAGTREPGDDFGYALAANDFNNDGTCDIAVGVPHEDNPASNEGGVVTIYSDGDGLEPGTGPSEYWSQDSGSVDGTGESGDAFGSILSSGDFDSDGNADLVIGVPLEDVGSHPNAGVVHVLYGQEGTITTDQSDLWHQGTNGMPGNVETEDRFGGAAA